MINPFYTIRGRLLLFGLCISLIPVTAITVVYYLNARGLLKRHQMDELSAIAEVRRLHVLSCMEAKKGRTRDFCSDGLIRESLESLNQGKTGRDDTAAALNKHLIQNKMPLDPHIAAITILDKDGKAVAATCETPEEKYVPGQDVFARTIAKGIHGAYVGHPFHAQEPEVDCIPVSAPITALDNAHNLGVLVAYYDLAALSGSLSNRAGLGESGEVYLTDKNGLIFTQSRFIKDAPLRKFVDKEILSQAFAQGGKFTGVYRDYRGVCVVGNLLYLPEFEWMLFAEIDKAEAFAPLRTLGIVSSVIGGVSAAVVIGTGILFAFSISGPINCLQAVTGRFASGDLAQRVTIRHKGEIGKLSQSFNEMADALSAEIAERKRREEQLRMLSLAVEQSPNTVIVTDINGNIEYVNPHFTKLTGYMPEEVIGKNPRILKSGETPREEYARMWNTITSGGEWHGEFHNKKKNGEYYWESAVISPMMDDQGNIIHFVTSKEDITGRKRAEEDKMREQQEKDVRSLDHPSLATQAAAPNERHRDKPLCDRKPGDFLETVELYAGLMDLALEEQTHKVEHRLSAKLRSIAEHLGAWKAGPRDVADVHSTALKRKCNGIIPAKAKAYTEEGRFMLIELMGYLVSYYRGR
jgi:PAS domain S-box-containing protein